MICGVVAPQCTRTRIDPIDSSTEHMKEFPIQKNNYLILQKNGLTGPPKSDVFGCFPNNLILWSSIDQILRKPAYFDIKSKNDIYYPVEIHLLPDNFIKIFRVYFGFQTQQMQFYHSILWLSQVDNLTLNNGQISTGTLSDAVRTIKSTKLKQEDISNQAQYLISKCLGNTSIGIDEFVNQDYLDFILQHTDGNCIELIEQISCLITYLSDRLDNDDLIMTICNRPKAYFFNDNLGENIYPTV